MKFADLGPAAWLAVVMATLLPPDSAWACRCSQQNLADYFNAADQVLMAELQQAESVPNAKRLQFRVMGPFYKGGADIVVGESVFFATEESTAGCGIQPDVGAIYVVFAHAPTNPDEDYRIDSCSGTRVHFSPSMPEPQGFVDVPARFVAQQLNGLGGLEVLKEVSANYPEATAVDNDSLLGLLDLKDLHHGGEVQLYTAPDQDAVKLESLSDYDLLQTREVAYEQAAAMVFSVLPGWYRLRLLDGRDAWLAAEQAGTWFPYADLQINRLSYLTRNWSGYVWPGPGAGLPIRHAAFSNRDITEFPVEILEHTEIGGTTWFRIRLLADDPCSNETFGNALAGWIPAYGANGGPTAWFYSRGC